MQFEKLTFENAQGDRLAARVDFPVDGDPLAYAVFAHCFTCSKDLKAAAHITTALTREGIAVLRFDFAGLGESEGDFADTNFSSNVEDLVEAAARLEEAYEAPKILVGHSFGGAAVLQAAARIDAVVAVATIGAPFDPQHVSHLFVHALDDIHQKGEALVQIAGRSFNVKKHFVEDLKGQHVRETLAGLKRALLVFHSPVDETVGVENAALIFEAAKHPKSFVSLDKADHLLTDESDARYVGAVLAAWAGKYIGLPQEEVKHTAPSDNVVTARIGASGYRTEIMANGFPLVADEPRAVGGSNAGPTPYDYLVAGLGACTAMTLRMYADRKSWPLEGTVVRLRHEKIHVEDCIACETTTGKIDHIDREVELCGPLSAEQRERLLEIANRCPVHRTLVEGEVEVKTVLRPGADAASSTKPVRGR